MWRQGDPRASLEEEDVHLYLGGWERGSYWSVGLGRGLEVWRVDPDHQRGGLGLGGHRDHWDEGGRNPVDRAVFVRLVCIGVCVVLSYNWVWVLLNYKVVLVLDLLALLSMEVLDLDFWREELQGIQALSTFVQANHPLGNLDIHQVPLVDRSRREVAVDPGPDIPGIHGPILGILGDSLGEGLLHLLHNCWGI